MEDISNPAEVATDPLADRQVALYGYLRGTNLRIDSTMHLIGVGDFG